MHLHVATIDILRSLAEAVEAQRRPIFWKEVAEEVEAARDAIGPGLAFRIGR
jgi:hypothetical protein